MHWSNKAQRLREGYKDNPLEKFVARRIESQNKQRLSAVF